MFPVLHGDHAAPLAENLADSLHRQRRARGCGQNGTTKIDDRDMRPSAWPTSRDSFRRRRYRFGDIARKSACLITSAGCCARYRRRPLVELGDAIRDRSTMCSAKVSSATGPPAIQRHPLNTRNLSTACCRSAAPTEANVAIALADYGHRRPCPHRCRHRQLPHAGPRRASPSAHDARTMADRRCRPNAKL